MPITYTWSATGQPPTVHVGGIRDTRAFNWDNPTNAQITVTVSNGWGTTTGTRMVDVQPALPATRTGSAVSLAIAPASLRAWNHYTLTARVPSGTVMRASVLTENQQVLDWLADQPIVDGENVIEPRWCQSCRLSCSTSAGRYGLPCARPCARTTELASRLGVIVYATVPDSGLCTRRARRSACWGQRGATESRHDNQ